MEFGEQIGAEMATFQNVSISKQSNAAGSKASAEYKDEFAKQIAAGKTVGTRQQAEKTAAVAVDLPDQVEGNRLSYARNKSASRTQRIGDGATVEMPT